MSGSISETGSSQPVNSIAGGTVADTGEADDLVSSGYSSSNSLSYAADDSSLTTDALSLVELDAPETGNGNTVNYAAQAFDARMEGFRSIFSDFNARFFSGEDGEVDVQNFLSDTQTLVMVFKGMVNDIKALNSAEAIGLASDVRANAQGHRLNAAELKNQIQSRASDIADANESLGQKNGQYSSLSALRQMKSQMLANAGNSAQAALLQQELAALDEQMAGIAVEVSNLNGVIQSLTAENAASRSRLTALESLVALAEETVVNVKALVLGIKEQTDKQSLETGEGNLRKKKRDNQQALHEASREGTRQSLKTDKSRARGKALVDQSIKATENALPTVIAEELQALLSPSLLTRLSTLFSTESASPSASLNKTESPSDQDRGDTAEALALALLASPPVSDKSVTASEENPADQPYLGDSLSLEGANNPQAFALLLLQDRMSQIHERVVENQALLSADAVDNGRVADILQLEGEVNQMLAEAQRDSQQAEAVIVRNSPV